VTSTRASEHRERATRTERAEARESACRGVRRGEAPRMMKDKQLGRMLPSTKGLL